MRLCEYLRLCEYEIMCEYGHLVYGHLDVYRQLRAVPFYPIGVVEYCVQGPGCSIC